MRRGIVHSVGIGWIFKTFCRSLWKVSASIVPLMSFSIKWRISRDRISDRAAKQSGPLRRWGICQSCLRQCDMYISQTSCTFPSLHRKKRLVLMTPSSSALLSPVSQWFAIFTPSPPLPLHSPPAPPPPRSSSNQRRLRLS